MSGSGDTPGQALVRDMNRDRRKQCQVRSRIAQLLDAVEQHRGQAFTVGSGEKCRRHVILNPFVKR
jgi:hypothetical protein